jgi:hypothetical protein
MPLKQFNRKKDIYHILFVSFLIPYLLLCLTLGGFHDGIGASHCNHGQQSGCHDYHDNACFQPVGNLDDVSQHNSETCQICQWLKTPSAIVQLLTTDAQFDFACASPPQNSNPVLPSLSIHKFTIRPPPSSSCLSA